MKQTLNLIWAEDLDGGIGYKGQMPWHLSADLKRFKKITTGHPVIMGAKTMKSLKRPLPGRLNLVLTHQNIQSGQWVTLPDLSALQDWLKTNSDNAPFVIGGATIYAQLLPFAKKLYRTVVLDHYRTDKKMPPVDYNQWQLVDRQDLEAQKGQPAARFETWQRP